MKHYGGDFDGVCIGCGCSQHKACPGGCGWAVIYDDHRGLCSRCRQIVLNFIQAAIEWGPLKQVKGAKHGSAL